MTGPARQTDVLVVGGGPAGLATAVELRRLGVAAVTVLEREAALGGVPRHTHHTGYGWRDLRRVLTGPAYARAYLELAERAGVDLRPGTTATGWAGPTSLLTAGRDGVVRWDARAVVLATGCRERPRSARLVPGTRPAGVLTTGALQLAADVHALPIGRRAVVVGAEHVSFSAVHTLRRHGETVVAVVTGLERPQAFPGLRWATVGLGAVPVLTRTEVTGIEGRDRVTGVRLTRADGRTTTVPCDTVVFTGDWIAEHELARRGGVPLDPGTRGPATDQESRTALPSIFAVGNLVHAAEAADVAALGGRHAARAVAALGDGTAALPDRPGLAVRVEGPLTWAFPAILRPGGGLPPRGRLLLRTAAFRDGGRLEVTQGDRLLVSRPVPRLVPHRSIGLPAAWVDRLDADGGPVRVRWVPQRAG